MNHTLHTTDLTGFDAMIVPASLPNKTITQDSCTIPSPLPGPAEPSVDGMFNVAAKLYNSTGLEIFSVVMVKPSGVVGRSHSLNSTSTSRSEMTKHVTYL